MTLTQEKRNRKLTNQFTMSKEKKITDKEFEELIEKGDVIANLLSPDQVMHITGERYTKIVVTDSITINKSVQWEYRVIKDVTFNRDLNISHLDIKSGIAFVNCEFKQGVVFREITTSDFNTTFNRYNCNVLFSNCKGSQVVFNDQCSFERGIVFEEKSEFEKVLIYNTEVQFNKISFNNSIVSKLLDIYNVEAELAIQEQSKIKSLRLSSCKGDVSLISSIFENDVKIWNCEFPNSFTLNKNTFEGAFNIKASRIKALYIHEDTFSKKAELENRDDSGKSIPVYCSKIYLTEAKFNEGFYFEGMGNGIDEIILKLSPNFQGLAKFNNWKVDKFELWGVCQDLKLLFKRMDFKFVLLNDFTNYGEISFDRCKAIDDSTLNLTDCDLGATKFNEFDFKSFNKLRIDNTIIDNIQTTNVSWFEEESLEISSNGSNAEISRRKRDFYRQIKHALSRSGNQIESLLFKAREMKAYRDELKSSGKYKWTENWVIMAVSRTNNFGMSWLKPVGIIFLLTLVFYTLMLPLFSDEIDYVRPNSLKDVFITFRSWCDNFNVFWQLFNPARKFSTVYGKYAANSGWLQFFDLFHRIILGIFIFQIIKGFRRLNTK